MWGDQLKVERSETKYHLGVTEYGKLSRLLPELLMADENNGLYGYRVRSLYFDGAMDSDYYEKVDGIENRKKIRLRIYNQDRSKVKLEMKIKKNLYQSKESIWIEYEDAILLQNGDYDCLEKYDDPLASKLRHLMVVNGYRPSVLIEYLRRAYYSEVSKTRITIDSELSSSEHMLDLYADSSVLVPVRGNIFAVLEVKSTGGLPSWVQSQIAPICESARAVSKYRESRWFKEEIGLL